MAWRGADPTDDIHAAERGSLHALCGEPVDTFGPPWPFPAQEWAAQPEDRSPCRYCVRLINDG